MGVHLFRGESTHPRIGGPPRSTRVDRGSTIPRTGGLGGP